MVTFCKSSGAKSWVRLFLEKWACICIKAQKYVHHIETNQTPKKDLVGGKGRSRRARFVSIFSLNSYEFAQYGPIGKPYPPKLKFSTVVNRAFYKIYIYRGYMYSGGDRRTRPSRRANCPVLPEFKQLALLASPKGPALKDLAKVAKFLLF